MLYVDPRRAINVATGATEIIMDNHIVAIDGPAAAGKTTTSLILAARYGLRYLESGTAYRLMAYLALRRGVRPDDENGVVALYQSLFGNRRDVGAMFEEGDRHARALRSPEVTRAVSTVSRLPELRLRITDLIRSWATASLGGVVEGRDIGTIVFPTAVVKFYLTAAPEVRARRRVADEFGRTYQEVLADVLRRDHADETRKASPLRPASGSVVIDTSDLSVDEVVAKMTDRCDSAGFAKMPGAPTG